MSKAFTHIPSEISGYPAYYRHEDPDTGEVTLRGYGGDIEFSYLKKNDDELDVCPFVIMITDDNWQSYELNLIRPDNFLAKRQGNGVHIGFPISELLALDFCRGIETDACCVEIHRKDLIEKHFFSFYTPD